MMTQAADQLSGALGIREFEATMAAVQIGSRYRIVTGGMKGLEGLASQVTRQGTILLEVKILGQNALLETNPDRLEPVPANEPALSGS